MARAKIREVSEASQIRGIASPVNTYVRPADPAPSNLHQLAKGLAALDSGLSGFLQKRNKEKNDADVARGTAAFYKANRTGWADAVATGLVPANSSPIFMEAYKKQQGKMAGIMLRDKFQEAYTTWDGRNSDDPAAFDAFLGEFIAGNIGTDDPLVLAGMNPYIEGLADSAMEMWGTENASRVYNGAITTGGALAGEEIDAFNSDGLASEEGTDYEGLYGSLVAQREEALSSGVASEDFDKTLVDAIVDKAIELEDPQLLDLLENTLPGQEVKISSLPEFRDHKQQAMDKLEAKARQRMADNDKAAEAIAEEAERKIVTSVMGALAENPTAPIPEEIIKEWEKYDQNARKKLVEARKSIASGIGLEDPRNGIAVEQAIQEGATKKDIMGMVSSGVISDPATLKNALDRVDKREKAMREGSGILRSQTAKRFAATIKERTMPADWEASFAPGGLTDEGIEATRDFEMMLMEWEENNPQASLMEREQAMNEIGELVLSRINPEERQYTSEQDAERMRQEAEEAKQLEQERPQQGSMVPGAAQDSTTSPSLRSRFKEAMEIDAGIGRPREADKEAYEKWEQEETERLYSGDNPPSLDEMDNSYRQRLEEQAEKLGLTPEEANMEIWKRLKEALLGGDTSESPSGDGPSSELQDQLEETIQGAVDTPVPLRNTKTASAKGKSAVAEVAQASTLLDLIGHTEGTDKRLGYNETLAYGKLTGGDVNLTGMTLGEIDKLQTDMLRHPANKWNSSALGRYQIVRKTLRSLKKQMGLSNDEKFTPELQDRLAIELLKGRGYDKWQSGKISDKQFMNRLAAEWASLPMASGKGRYSGQRTGATPDEVLTAFTGIRSHFGDADEAFAAVDKTDVVRTAYAKIPKREVSQFMQWNSDPVGNHEKNLKSIDKPLANVVRRAQEIADVKFVVGSGKRDKALQQKAIKWGWSKTMNSDHLHGGAVDLWPIDEDGAVTFNKTQHKKIVKAMKQAAKELGVSLDAGADWKSFKDMPHFALKS